MNRSESASVQIADKRSNGRQHRRLGVAVNLGNQTAQCLNVYRRGGELANQSTEVVDGKGATVDIDQRAVLDPEPGGEAKARPRQEVPQLLRPVSSRWSNIYESRSCTR